MQSSRIKILSNVIIFVVILLVFLIGFVPSMAVTISSNDSYSAIYRGNSSKNGVSLMFNVYENTEIVENILDVLNDNNAKATFFVGGCWADDNQNTLKRIISDGHELANHGYFHKDHKKLSYDENVREILDCDKIVTALTGYKMVLFAPPSGSFSKNTLNASINLGYKTIMWSKDTIDWRDSDENLLIKRATSNLSSGDFILMHPKKHTLSALPKIIDIIEKENLKLLTVSDALKQSDL